MYPTLIQKNIEIEVVLKDTDLILMADAALIEQVLINLVVNAIEALKDMKHAKIILSTYRKTTGKIVLKVADNGKGIPVEVLDKIFIPFFSTRKNGSGIGLTLCKQIMMMHHASIGVNIKEKDGTVFFLQF